MAVGMMSVVNERRSLMEDNNLDLENYLPFYIVTISNRWTSASSRHYLTNFGIGVGEWRVLASTYSLGETTSNAISNFVLMDAAAVSRALGRLEEKALIEFVPQSNRVRSKSLKLTEAGEALYMQIRETAYARQNQLLKGLSESEKTALVKVLRKVMNNLDEVDQF